MNDYFNHIREMDPAARSVIEMILLYPSVHVMLFFRLSNFMYRKGLRFIPRLLSQLGRFFTGIEIHPGATIGKNLFIDHGMGVVIGETTIIGNNVTIYQGVTLGGTGKDIGKRHPTIEDGVIIGAGANILGPIVISKGSKIGSGAIVVKDTEENSTTVGHAAKTLKIENIIFNRYTKGKENDQNKNNKMWRLK